MKAPKTGWLLLCLACPFTLPAHAARTADTHVETTPERNLNAQDRAVLKARFPKDAKEQAALNAACLESPGEFNRWIFGTDEHPYEKGSWQKVGIPRKYVLSWCQDELQVIKDHKSRLTQTNAMKPANP